MDANVNIYIYFQNECKFMFFFFFFGKKKKKIITFLFHPMFLDFLKAIGIIDAYV